MERKNTKILHKELSYILQGCLFDIRKQYGSGHKETVYKNLLAERLKLKGLSIEIEKIIPIYSDQSGQMVGNYRSDLVLEKKIIIELKASKFTTRQDEEQILYYLRNTVYEIGYLINFGMPKLAIRRLIYTNDCKIRGFSS